MDFRRATLADVAAITALTRAAYAHLVPLIGREPAPMLADYSVAVADHMIDILVHPEPIALIEMIAQPDHLWIENIAVHPDFQGKGLGHRLVDHAVTTARSLGLNDLRLLTNEAFAANLRFYAGLGFVPTDRTQYKGGFTLHFHKHLAPCG